MRVVGLVRVTSHQMGVGVDRQNKNGLFVTVLVGAHGGRFEHALKEEKGTRVVGLVRVTKSPYGSRLGGTKQEWFVCDTVPVRPQGD